MRIPRNEKQGFRRIASTHLGVLSAPWSPHLVRECCIYLKFRSGLGSTRDTGRLSPHLNGLKTASALIGRVDVGGTTEEV
jgi:hypothetical protein